MPDELSGIALTGSRPRVFGALFVAAAPFPLAAGFDSWRPGSLLPGLTLGLALCGAGLALLWWTRSRRRRANNAQERRSGHQVEPTEERDRLRESEEKFSKIFKASPDAITISSPWEGGLIVDVNEGFERLTGYSAAEATGRTTLELGFWMRPEERLEMMAKILEPEGRIRDREVELRMRSGEVRTCVLSAEIIEVGGRRYAVTVTRDVTEQRLAERRLHESEERLRRALDAAQMGTWEWNMQTGALVWSPQLEALVGLPPGAFGGTFAALQETVHPDDRRRVEEEIERSLSSESGVFRVERRVAGADPPRWLEVRGRVFRDATGRPVLMRGTAGDVSDRKRAEEALRESETRSRAILQALPDLMFRLSRDGVHLDFHASSLNRLYLAPAAFLGKNVRDVLPLEVADRYLQHIALALDDKQMQLFEYELRFAEGDRRHYEARMTPCGRDDVLVIVRDVSEARRSEEALRRSEAELRALFSSMDDVILVLDAEGRYLSIAPTNPALLYRPSAELLGRRLHEVFPAAEADLFLGQIRSALEARRTLRFEYPLDLQGSRHWFAATVSPMLNDAVVWVARDVTEAKRAEEALRESEERWRRLSEASFEGIAMTENGIMFDVNAQLAQMLGYAPEELIGMPVQDCVVSGDRARVGEAMREAVSSAYEHGALRKDGSRLLVEVRGRPSTLHGRKVRLTAVRDISERARLERELRRRETLAAMGSLVAGVAHEVRTPLFSLSATLDTLESGVASPADEQELRDLLRSQVRRLSTLMQDLLDYGRTPQLRLVMGSLGPVVDHVVRGGQSQAERAGVRIQTQVPADLPPTPIDAGRLGQVLDNLLLNALQHAPRGSTVGICARRSEERAGIVCAVLDEGPGLTPADLERVFEPFFTRRKGGTGMGLALAQRFVEAHGGSLTAGNRPEGGAVFTVFLPAEVETGGARA